MKLSLLVSLATGALAACTSPGGAIDCRSYPDAPACRVLADTSVDATPSDTGGGGGPDATTCRPSCDGRACGSDGCGGTCGACGAGTTCRAGVCVEGACGEAGLEVSGRFEVGEGFVFDTATVELEHKMDVDAFEDGCLTRIVVSLKKGFGCLLVAEGEGALVAGGGFRISSLSLSADSQCPGFPDADEGEYDDTDDMDVLLIVPGTYDVEVDNAPEACLVTDVEVRLAGWLGDGVRQQIEIRPTTLRIRGEMRSNGSTSASCPCVPACDGRQCGGDGCGGVCGACGDDERCTADGRCECVPDCRGVECGDDGCGGSCGSCEARATCELGACVACQPSCDGRACGDDGCGGSCGDCGAGTRCEGGQCRCVSSCAGVACGNDGCGGSCGSCGANASCQAGQCVAEPTCGDGTCSEGEICPDDCSGICNGTCEMIDQLFCPSDCAAGTNCGDDTCDPEEHHDACPEDCAPGCGDGLCANGEGGRCPYDCSTCGDGVCSGLELFSCTADCFGF